MLPAALNGVRRESFGRAGRLSFYVAGEGAPLLLVHSINAAGSAYEVKPIFDALVGSRRVYAVDLPGFGFSDRSKRDYTPRLYTDAIHDMLDVVAKDEMSTAPIDALAVSLGSEFLARAAVEAPGRFRTLTLVTPTGFQQRLRQAPRQARRDAAGAWPLRRVHLPAMEPGHLRSLGVAPEHPLLPAQDIRLGSALTKGSPNTTISPRIRTAPRTRRSPSSPAGCSPRTSARSTKGSRCRCGCRTAPRAISAISATRAGPRARTNWRVEPFDTGALPHFEEPQKFMAEYRRFLADAAIEAHAA